MQKEKKPVKEVINSVLDKILIAKRMEDLRDKRIDSKLLERLESVKKDFNVSEIFDEDHGNFEIHGCLYYVEDVESIIIESRLNWLGIGIESVMKLVICDAGIVFVEMRKNKLYDNSVFQLNSDIDNVVQCLINLDVEIKQRGAKLIFLILQNNFEEPDFKIKLG